MSVISKKDKKVLIDFSKFIIKELKIKDKPKIILQNGRGKLKTTASYEYTNEVKVIRVNCKNRALVDILRSLAHEMVHHKQYENGELNVKPADIGGKIEDEANAKAGQFIKMYAKENNEIYDEN
jgi:hypothetical protein